MLTGPGEIEAASAKAAMDRDRLMRGIRLVEVGLHARALTACGIEEKYLTHGLRIFV
ncbi:hypothetical protein PPUN12996_32810 [Pseudomonas putida]|nr:hypothetical protein PPUN12996_32810 [Pseudomonas putida]